MDYFLQATDEPTMNAALIAAGVMDDEGNPITGHVIDVIGTWFERTGGSDEEPVMTHLPGWHVNVRSAELIQWPDSVTLAQPKTPWRVFG